MKRNLTRKERLSSQKEIKDVFNRGEKKFSIPGNKILAKQNGREYSRFAVVLVRKTGNSVKRNKIKRIAREVFRLNKEQIESGWDIIVIFYPDSVVDFHIWKDNFLSLITRAGLIKTD